MEGTVIPGMKQWTVEQLEVHTLSYILSNTARVADALYGTMVAKAMNQRGGGSLNEGELASCRVSVDAGIAEFLTLRLEQFLKEIVTLFPRGRRIPLTAPRYRINCYFWTAAINKNQAEKQRAVFEALLTSYPKIRPGLTYVGIQFELSKFKFNTEQAIMLMALGQALGKWRVDIPKAEQYSVVDPDEAAAIGMIKIASI